jgi:rhamnose utilization protein RhaD (predicted bifunctional aldolase and dehydrogenase)/NAD(P)-dependent dehydrogenase (short-subunit alcohol dehydrogenase family)
LVSPNSKADVLQRRLSVPYLIKTKGILMINRWNEQEAAALGNDPLALRVYTSRLLGAEPSLVLHGGGNTSVKTTITDFFGEPEQVLYVKGSGWDLATIQAAGFAPVRLRALLRLAEFPGLSDADMVKQQRAALLDPGAPTPSVEAILHALLPFAFVDHTHADAVVTLMNTPDGEARVRDLYGPNMLIVPYVMPGFILARTVYEMTRDIDWPTLDGILLMHHGVFTFADDARASYERHLEIVNRAEAALAPYAPLRAAVMPPLDEDLPALARLRRAVSLARGGACLAQTDAGEEAVAFSRRPDVAAIATRGLLTPDHVLRAKRVPLVVQGEVEAAVEAYVQDYRAYFERHAATASQPLTPLDPAPRWAVWPGQGVVSFGRTVKEILPVADMARHTRRAIELAEALGGWHTLSEDKIFEVEYWELEQAKLDKGGVQPPLLGKIAIVSGAASGIGKACVEALAAQGAAVTALDINPAIQETFRSSQIQGLVCDVTDSTALQAAVESTVRRFGGLDIIVCNAGIFPSSQTIEAMDEAAWARSLDLNLTSHQRLMQYSIPYLKLGIDPAIVIIASKNVPAPGPGAGAYSVAKAGLTQLGRVAALELGPLGIRVNMLHPNAVFDTGIWTPEVLAKRAASYGISVEEYKKNNLLKTEITSHDVAALVCALAGPLFGKTTGAQVPIDGGNDRVI